MEIVPIIQPLQPMILPVILKVTVDLLVQRSRQRLIIPKAQEFRCPLVQIENLCFRCVSRVSDQIRESGQNNSENSSTHEHIDHTVYLLEV